MILLLAVFDGIRASCGHHLLLVLFPELSKACEQVKSKEEEQRSDQHGMQNEALVEELQVVKSQCDMLTAEHKQTKALCRQLHGEKEVSRVTVWCSCDSCYVRSMKVLMQGDI